MPAEQKALLLRQIRELSGDRAKMRAESEALGRQIAAAERLMRDATETVRAASIETPDPSFQLLNERLTKLRADRAHILTTYQPDATTARNIDEEIVGLEALLARQQTTQLGSVTSQTNPLRQQLQQRVQEDRVRLEGLTAADAADGRQIARLQSELDGVERADARLTELERDRQVAEQSYLTALKRRDDAEAAAQLDVSRVSNVSVAMPPVATPEPVYPRKLLIMAVALVVGLGLGVALALALEWMSDTVRGPEQIESATDLVCLGTVSFEQWRTEAGR